MKSGAAQAVPAAPLLTALLFHEHH